MGLPTSCRSPLSRNGNGSSSSRHRRQQHRAGSKGKPDVEQLSSVNFGVLLAAKQRPFERCICFASVRSFARSAGRLMLNACSRLPPPPPPCAPLSYTGVVAAAAAASSPCSRCPSSSARSLILFLGTKTPKKRGQAESLELASRIRRRWSFNLNALVVVVGGVATAPAAPVGQLWRPSLVPPTGAHATSDAAPTREAQALAALHLALQPAGWPAGQLLSQHHHQQGCRRRWHHSLSLWRRRRRREHLHTTTSGTIWAKESAANNGPAPKSRFNSSEHSLLLLLLLLLFLIRLRRRQRLLLLLRLQPEAPASGTLLGSSSSEPADWRRRR